MNDVKVEVVGLCHAEANTSRDVLSRRIPYLCNRIYSKDNRFAVIILRLVLRDMFAVRMLKKLKRPHHH